MYINLGPTSVTTFQPNIRPPVSIALGEDRGYTSQMSDSPSSSSISWPVRAPFVQTRRASEEDIDDFGHVNNLRYIHWAMETAWAHSGVLGLAFSDYERLGVGCVVWRHEFEYAAPVLLGDLVDCATWIAGTDKRVRLTRAFEMRRADKLVFRGRTVFVTIDMKTGKPARMPKAFIDAYQAAEPAPGAAQPEK